MNANLVCRWAPGARERTTIRAGPARRNRGFLLDALAPGDDQRNLNIARGREMLKSAADPVYNRCGNKAKLVRLFMRFRAAPGLLPERGNRDSMFEFIRSHRRWMQFILLLLIVPSFFLVGIQGYESFMRKEPELATVAGQPVTRAEFDQAHRNQLEQFRQRMARSSTPPWSTRRSCARAC